MMGLELTQDKRSAGQAEKRSYFISDLQFWSIAIIFLLITLHHYDNLTSFRLFGEPDLPLGLTRHTIDRILYLLPIALSSLAFGSRGGKITVVAAFLVMLPRAFFISPYGTSSFWEVIMITLIGSFVPFWIDHYRRQGQQLEATIEKLESTERKLHTTVKLTLEQERQLSVINTFSRMLSQSLAIDQILKAAADIVMGLIDVEVIQIYSLDPLSQTLKLSAYEGIDDNAARALDTIKVGEGHCGQVAKTGVPLAEENTLSVPLTARGAIVGTICVASHTERKFKEPEIKLLSALGNLIGIAINNSVLYQERKKATDQLEASEKRFRQLFENAHDAIWVQGLSGEITAANQAAAELFGCDLAELVGERAKQFSLPDEPILSERRREAILEGKEDQKPYSRKIIKKDGSEAFVMLTANLVTKDGNPDGIQFIGRDITKEVRMQENQSFYLQQITRAHEEERQRISRDLHDSTAQNLVAMLRRLERFNEENIQLSEEKQKFLWNLHGQLKSTLQEIRQLSRDLRPSVLDNLGLLPAVEWLAEQLESEHNIRTSLAVFGKEKRFSQEIEITLFRIIQEALRNIAKHAEATEAQVTIEFKDAETKVVISDNGKGFDLPQSLGELSRRGKLGIDGMQTRARLAGGTFNIQSELGKGTTIMVTIPA